MVRKSEDYLLIGDYDPLENVADPHAEDGFAVVLFRLALEQSLQGFRRSREWVQLVMEGCSGAEAARRLGLSPVWLNRVREHLRQTIFCPEPRKTP